MLGTVGPLLFLVGVAVVRELQGGPGATFAPMIALPVIWLALFGTRDQLLLGTLAAGAVIALPALLARGPYMERELSLALTYVIVLAIAGFAVSALMREREALLEELSALARTDPLTGLANRRAWQEMLERELARSARYGSPLSVAILDLDRFKGFNDRNGHAAGDRLLRTAASRWSEQIRAIDGVARYGGEEFAFLLPGAELADAGTALERIRGATPPGVSASVGVATWDGSEGAEALLQRADRALYEAKRRGRDQVCASQPGAGPPPVGREGPQRASISSV